MPSLNGFEAFTRIRRLPELRQVVVIAVTALASASERDGILAHGFDGCIAKPITPATFVPQIERLIQVHGPPGSSAAGLLIAARDSRTLLVSLPDRSRPCGMRRSRAHGRWRERLRRRRSARTSASTSGWWRSRSRCAGARFTEIVRRPVRLYEAADRSRWTDYGSFTTGVYDTFVLVETAGAAGGLQINLTILGARLFLGQPLRDLMNRAIALDDLFGAAAGRLEDELQSATDWGARFDIVDRELLARIQGTRGPSADVRWAVRRLVQTNGRVTIGTLLHEVRCGPGKGLVSQFHEQLGVTPKTLARVSIWPCHRADQGGCDVADRPGDRLRLLQSVALRSRLPPLAGTTPTELIRSTLAESGGFSADR